MTSSFDIAQDRYDYQEPPWEDEPEEEKEPDVDFDPDAQDDYFCEAKNQQDLNRYLDWLYK